jgi:hypothetical protein
MTKARDLADLISAGNPLADGSIAASEVTGLSAVATSGAASDVSGLAAVATSGAVADVSGAAPTASPTFTGVATVNDLSVGDGRSGGVYLENNGRNNDFFSAQRTASLPTEWATVRISQEAAYTGLKINGDTSQTGNYFEITDSTGSDELVVKSSGNVGIGDSVANERLSINGGNIRLETQPSTTRRIYALGGSQSYVLNSTGGAAIAFERDASNNDEIAFETHAQGAAHAERMRIGNYGQLGFNGANYGTSGQVLTSSGSGAAPTWADAATGGTAFSAF